MVFAINELSSAVRFLRENFETPVKLVGFIFPLKISKTEFFISFLSL